MSASVITVEFVGGPMHEKTMDLPDLLGPPGVLSFPVEGAGIAVYTRLGKPSGDGTWLFWCSS